MEIMDIEETISQVDLFSGLDEDQFSLLAGYFSRVSFRRGDVIFREGETGHSLSIIVDGAVDIVLPERADKIHRISEIILSTLGPGEIFGEYSLVDLRPTSASAVVNKDCELLQIHNRDFRHLLDEHCHVARVFYENLLVLLIDRLRHNNEELDLFSNSWTPA